jgi:hypothetical protein
MLVFVSSLLHFLLTVLVPLLGVVLAAALLVYGVYVRWFDAPQKWVLAPRALQVLCAVAVLCNAVLLWQLYRMNHAQQTREDHITARASRERFVLPRDFQYGELLIPAGSLVNRQDPFYRGEPAAPLALHGLEAVRFAQPVEVAGVWASALQTTPARVELAQNQTVGPVYSVNSRTQRWERNRVKPTMACRKGQIAVFMVPHIPHDVQAEVGKPPPDGPDARFLPSQWMFRHCENGPAIALEPAR